MIITGKFQGKTGDEFIVTVVKAYMVATNTVDRLGEMLAQMPYLRRCMPTDLSFDKKGRMTLTDAQEQFLFNASLRIGQPYFEERLLTVENRQDYTDAEVAGGLRYVELNPILARQHADPNDAVLEGCRNVRAWLQMA